MKLPHAITQPSVLGIHMNPTRVPELYHGICTASSCLGVGMKEYECTIHAIVSQEGLDGAQRHHDRVGDTPHEER
jgi:hypothetical protein